MMTQADVLSESMKTDESGSAAYVNEAASRQNSPQSSQPDLVPSQAVTYKYDQSSMNGEIQLGLSQNPVPKTENSPIQPSKYFAQDSAMNSSKGLRNIIIGGMVFSGIITIALIIQIAVGTTQVPYRIGIVTAEKVCSDIGADMVHKGGKSIDAFIASSLCLGVVNPFSAGPGAGGFLLIRDHKHDKNVALNCFFKSSETLDPKDYATNPVEGQRSVGIPGEYKCIKEVYRYARFNWKKLTAPVIKLARDGFRVTRQLSDNLKKLSLDEIKNDPYMADVFLKSNGELVKENDLVKNERLAKSIESLRDGEDPYENDIAASIVAKSELTANDLRNYKSQSDKISKTNYNDFVLLTAPFPSNGPILKYVLEMMQTLSLKIDDFSKPEFFTNLLHAASMGYKMAAYTADPSDTTLLTIYQQALKDSKAFFKALVAGSASTAKDPLSDFKLDSYELKDDFLTNFISVNDHNDLMISYTGTLGSAWGSKVMTADGFMLNNALNYFTYGSENSNENNGIMSNKQPRALFTPILTYNDKNPCVRRFAVSYGHKNHMNDDFALSEVTEILVKLFTDFKLYETAISDKRVQYNFEQGSCFEDGFSSQIKSDVLGKKLWTERSNCSFHGIDLIMKKDHIIYSQVDSNRSLDYAVIFNK